MKYSPKRFKKAIGALVAVPVTFLVVDQLGGTEQLAVGLSTVVTSFVVAKLRNLLAANDGERVRV